MWARKVQQDNGERKSRNRLGPTDLPTGTWEVHPDIQSLMESATAVKPAVLESKIKNRNQAGNSTKTWWAKIKASSGKVTFQPTTSCKWGQIPGANLNNFFRRNPYFHKEELLQNPERTSTAQQKQLFSGIYIKYKYITEEK